MSNKEQFKEVIKDFVSRTDGHYGSYAFACGYLGSMLVSYFEHLPKAEQIAEIERMIRAVETYSTKEYA